MKLKLIKNSFFELKDFFLAILLTLPFSLLYWKSQTGDAAIYFTFIKNFFIKPFSFFPGNVSFGATSPLVVILFAPIYKIFGSNNWILIAKIINLSFIPLGIVLINRAIKGNLLTLFIGCALISVHPRVFYNSASLYESGISFILLSALYFYLIKKQYLVSSIIGGFLYLARPELITITLAINLYILLQTYKKKFKLRDQLMFLFFLYIPTFLYHFYMFANTQQIIPSSILARGMRSLESSLPWHLSFIDSWEIIFSHQGFIYIISLFILIKLILTRKICSYKVEFLIILPIVNLYIIFPPGGYLSRYLSLILPICLALCLKILIYENPFIFKFSKNRKRFIGLISIIILIINSSIVYIKRTRYGVLNLDLRKYRERILRRDLATKLNPLINDKDEILIYEIQSQYYLKGKCISFDGIVGNELHPVLYGSMTYEEFIQSNKNLRFIVTHESSNYRDLYKDTLIKKIYKNESKVSVGETLTIDNIYLKKIFHNENNNSQFRSVFEIMRNKRNYKI